MNSEKRCKKVLLQKEKKKRRNKLSIRNVLKKEIIYERRNRSLSFRTNLFFFPPKKPPVDATHCIAFSSRCKEKIAIFLRFFHRCT